MYSDWVWLLALAVFFWLGILSFLVWQQTGFLKSLFPKSGERDIRKKFEEVLEEVAEFKVNLGGLTDQLLRLEKQGLKHIQRVELLRFNPYDDTGGDQSFVLALLNKEGDGFVLNSLHARSGTRIFAKPVVKGKEGKYQLSKEEKEVIDLAMAIKL